MRMERQTSEAFLAPAAQVSSSVEPKAPVVRVASGETLKDLSPPADAWVAQKLSWDVWQGALRSFHDHLPNFGVLGIWLWHNIPKLESPLGLFARNFLVSSPLPSDAQATNPFYFAHSSMCV